MAGGCSFSCTMRSCWARKVLKVEKNIACQRVIEEGDLEEGFAKADLIVEETFSTGRVYHGQMETKGCGLQARS